MADVCFSAIAFCFCAYCFVTSFFSVFFSFLFFLLCEMGGQDEFFNYILQKAEKLVQVK